MDQIKFMIQSINVSGTYKNPFKNKKGLYSFNVNSFKMN